MYIFQKTGRLYKIEQCPQARDCIKLNMPSSASLTSLRRLLIGLDRPGAHITYNTVIKLANFYSSASESPHLGVRVSSQDLLALFEKTWIVRYDSSNGEYRYRITDVGRAAID